MAEDWIELGRDSGGLDLAAGWSLAGSGRWLVAEGAGLGRLEGTALGKGRKAGWSLEGVGLRRERRRAWGRDGWRGWHSGRLAQDGGKNRRTLVGKTNAGWEDERRPPAGRLGLWERRRVGRRQKGGSRCRERQKTEGDDLGS
ncbi:hypothetical protein ACLOJK_009744 [Asimina triloba]